MIPRFAIALLPVISLAQTPAGVTPAAPPAVDQALRARVSQFLQYHIDGEFRKAYDMVAEDTRDEYFNSAKMRLLKFDLVDVQYTNGDFTKAKVNATVTMNWNIRQQENVSIVPMLTTWKIENGKWVWYHDVQAGDALPMGESKVIPGLNDRGTKLKIPEKIDDAALQSAASRIVKQVTIDKQGVSLSTGKDQAVIHNGTPGYIQLSWAGLPEVPGFSAKFDKVTLGPNEDGVVRFEYKPASKEPVAAFPVRVVVEPFNQVFAVMVNTAAPDNQ